MSETTRRSSGGGCTLRAEYYTSPAVYDLETERIFERRWIFAALACEIPEPGGYVLAEVEGESLIVLRDRDDGDIRAFYNVCRHRGTRLCEAPAGTLKKHIVCPYHAWAYDHRGALVAAPNMDGVEGFDRAGLPLHRAAVHVWEGMIFVCLDGDPEPFGSAFPALRGKFGPWRLDDLRSVHRTRYDVEANWKLLVQNYSECYHCPSLHPALNRLTPYRDTSNDLDEGPVVGGPMRLSPGHDTMSADGRTCGVPFGHLDEAGRRLVHYYVMFPSMFLSLMPDYAIVHRLVRRGPARTTVVCDWLFHPEAIERAGFDSSRAVDFWDQTNRQDWRICELSQAGIGSRAYRPGPYADLESLLAALDREYLRAMGMDA